jgi:spermidine synthase
VDIDLTTNTDCEDMLVFIGDIVEFVEQDKSFFLDAILDSYSTVGWGGALFAVEVYMLTLLKRQTLSVLFAKLFCA